jgi:hypothetical protein
MEKGDAPRPHAPTEDEWRRAAEEDLMGGEEEEQPPPPDPIPVEYEEEEEEEEPMEPPRKRRRRAERPLSLAALLHAMMNPPEETPPYLLLEPQTTMKQLPRSYMKDDFQRTARAIEASPTKRHHALDYFTKAIAQLDPSIRPGGFLHDQFLDILRHYQPHQRAHRSADGLYLWDRWFLRMYPREAAAFYDELLGTHELTEAYHRRHVLPTQFHAPCRGYCHGCRAATAHLTDGTYLWCSEICQARGME